MVSYPAGLNLILDINTIYYQYLYFHFLFLLFKAELTGGPDVAANSFFDSIFVWKNR